MSNRVSLGAAIAATIFVAPVAFGQTVAPAPVHVQPANSQTLQQPVRMPQTSSGILSNLK